jgi:diadenosine tetraphosphate (Ap4A) HIT family hydrolase
MPEEQTPNSKILKTHTGGRCALCIALADGRSAQPILCNTILLETDLFTVLPSLGPFAPGHVMVVSKFHTHNLASMGAEAIDEYERLACQLRLKAPLLRNTNPLEAEHGSSAQDKAGACVMHTHVHWIPHMGHFRPELAERLPQQQEIRLLDITNPDSAYVFARSDNGSGVSRAQGLSSQTIRRILCEITDRDDADWKQALRPDWIKETVKAWHNCRSD